MVLHHLSMRDLIQTHQHNPSGSLCGLKRDLLEGGHRVPLIASWPGHAIKGGHRIDAMLSLTDLFATVAGIAEVSLADGIAEDSLDIMLGQAYPQGSGLPRSQRKTGASTGTLGVFASGWNYKRARLVQ